MRARARSLLALVLSALLGAFAGLSVPSALASITVAFGGSAINSTGSMTLGTNGTTTAVTIDTGQVMTLAHALPTGSGGLGLDVSGVTDGQFPIGATSGHTFALGTITGTSNQITVTVGTNTITLAAPQSIGTGSSPTFQKINVNQLAKTVHASTTGTTVTLDTTATFWPIDTTSNNCTATLPTAVSISGVTYTIKKTVAANTLTIGTTSSQTIDGASTYVITVAQQSVSVISDGSNWLIE